jgi:phosphatidylglycerol:prolipoprotein diacylglycerol transferase
MVLIHPSIDPVIVSFNFLEIRWYGLAYVAAFIIGGYLIKFFNQRYPSNLNRKLIDDFFVWAIIGVIFGGRIGYVFFYQIENFIKDPIYILYIWKGGMSFHGGLAGMTLGIYLFSKKNNINFFELSDLVSLVAPIGLFFGRIANFINIELYGRVTNFPFAMIYPTVDNLPRHPSQLYEACFEGIILFLILFIFFIRNDSKQQFGMLSGLFLLLYGVFRFLIEFLREPDEHLGLFLKYFSMGQLLCIPLIVVGILIYLKKYQSHD